MSIFLTPKPASLSEAERAQVLKSVDAWWTVLLTDPIAVRVLPMLRHRAQVTPFRVTIAAAVCGLASATCLLAGLVTPAILLFQTRFLLDCIDGKLARLRGTACKSGGFLDLNLDIAVLLVNFLAVGFYRSGSGLALSVGVVISYLLYQWVRLYSDNIMPTLKVWHSLGTQSWNRRLARRPCSIDVEMGVICIAPLLSKNGSNLLCGIAIAYYTISAIRRFVTTYVVLDRDRTSGKRGLLAPE